MGYVIALVIEYVILPLLVVYLIVDCVRAKKARQLSEYDGMGASAPSPDDPNETEKDRMFIANAFVAADTDKAADIVRFSANMVSFKDAYEALSEEQKKYFHTLHKYAMDKEGAEEKRAKSAILVRIKKKPIIKLQIRRGITVASFKLESELMRGYKRQAETSKGIKEKETDVYVTDETILNTACGMVDLMLQQYAKERQEAIDRRNAKRAERRASQRASEEVGSPTEE